MTETLRHGNYDFTQRWFRGSGVPKKWPKYIKEWQPRKALEIGCFEGQTATFLLDMCPSVKELYCIDTWGGSVEHGDGSMGKTWNFVDVEYRFGRNIIDSLERRDPRPEVIKLKGFSHRCLSQLIEEHEGTFDWVYIDGSHFSDDVLIDAVLALKLLRPGGLMIFDDYEWKPHDDMANDVNLPMMGIDAFIKTHKDRHIDVMEMGYQVFLRKKPS